MIVLIDNYDSFVHNLERYLRRLGQQTLVVRNDAITPDEVLDRQPTAVVLSPGPCTPSEAGCSLELVRLAVGRIPLLGVCLGHQAIAAALGGRVVRGERPVHGRTSRILHHGAGLFAGLPSPLVVGRYHSLVVDEETLPRDLEVTARTDDGIVMALAHRQWPVFGVQFHPESILTDQGYSILANFLRLAGIDMKADVPAIEMERPLDCGVAPLPTGPVTF
ncbi:MAG TPA: aminodeoxychorismate/anthranilate synthase component II [Pirellulaceae bacterium]|nr:aminodeoxychorismate/anthranilate synthase component II [Pirellulaceae bacterium]